MYLTLIVVPHSIPWTRENSADGEQSPHLPRLEYSTLWIDKWNANALKDEAGLKIVACERRTHRAHALDVLESSKSHSRVRIEVLHCEYGIRQEVACGRPMRKLKDRGICAQCPFSVNAPHSSFPRRLIGSVTAIDYRNVRSKRSLRQSRQHSYRRPPQVDISH